MDGYKACQQNFGALLPLFNTSSRALRTGLLTISSVLRIYSLGEPGIAMHAALSLIALS